MSESSVIVSVILPAYNSSGTLRLALQTVLWQDFKNFEVWVIGDGCTDDSERVVASFKDDRFHWVNLPINSGGPSLPRREGLSHAAGRYVAYIGQDDLWFPWHLSELVNCIETSKSEFVYSLGAIISADGIIGTFSLAHKAWSRTEFISPTNWLHQKTMAKVGGLWSKSKPLGDDQEFLRRMLDAKVKLAFRKQLSVLKFPAALWRMYSIKNDFPQEKYVEALRDDAEALRTDLLLEFAAFKSVAYQQKRPLYRRFVSRCIDDLFWSYGLHRWPLNQFLYQRYRKRAGLTSNLHQSR